MVTKETLKELVVAAAKEAGFSLDEQSYSAIEIEYPESKHGDFSTNAAMVLAKAAKSSPRDAAEKIKAAVPTDYFERIEIAGPGFINFFLKNDFLTAEVQSLAEQGVLKGSAKSGKILLEYFQPNIAKPLHVGHLRTAIIGDAIKRMLLHVGYDVESDTHMGDWGTQFGQLILAYKKYGKLEVVAADPITELNKLYVHINQEIEKNPELHELAKAEFVKLEKGDDENRNIWKQFVDWSMEKHLKINDLMDILPFDHHWPESFYEDKMPAVLETLKSKGLLKESQGAQIVDLEDQSLGVAIIVKSDGGTTYLLRDLATFRYIRGLGYDKHLYVVDSRQSLHYRQLFAILTLMNEMQDGEGIHIDYGFMSFKGEVLSTRKGNMVLAEDVIKQAEEKVAKVIEEKNPDLKDKAKVVKAVSKASLKYFDLSHNRHSDIEFNWDEALDFEGNSGPYLQYVYARLSSILRKEQFDGNLPANEYMTPTERQILVEMARFNDFVEAAIEDYLPNIMANYMHDLATLINKFYHESPVIKETDPAKKQLRLGIVAAAQKTMGTGLELLGITPLEEM